MCPEKLDRLKEITQLKFEILILQKVSHKSKMLIGFGILVMRRFMTQISKKVITLEIKLKYKLFNS